MILPAKSFFCWYLLRTRQLGPNAALECPCHRASLVKPALLERLRVELEKMHKQRDNAFYEKRCLGEMKNQKNEKIYGDPKKLSSFKKVGKVASIQSNFSAAWEKSL